jgi:hypothetical protein
MKYSSLQWTPKLEEIEELENDDLLLLRDKKGIHLYRVIGNLPNDLTFKLQGVSNREFIVADKITNCLFAKL